MASRRPVWRIAWVLWCVAAALLVVSFIQMALGEQAFEVQIPGVIFFHPVLTSPGLIFFH